MILGFMNANAQSPEKIEQLKDTVSTFADEKLLKDLQDATGIMWTKEGADALFDYSPDAPEEKTQVRKIPKLNIGAYGHVAKVTGQNHTREGKIKYTVDISDRRYMESNIFNRIKEYNSDLKDVIIQFTIKGSPLPTKNIKL